MSVPEIKGLLSTPDQDVLPPPPPHGPTM